MRYEIDIVRNTHVLLVEHTIASYLIDRIEHYRGSSAPSPSPAASRSIARASLRVSLMLFSA